MIGDKVEVGAVFVDRDKRKPERYLRVERVYMPGQPLAYARCVRVTRNAMSEGLFVEASPRRMSNVLLSRLQSRDYGLAAAAPISGAMPASGEATA